MKPGYIFLYAIILSPFSLSSCTKDASYVTLPEFTRKINIRAFISPDQSENKIFVGATMPRFGELKIVMNPVGNVSLNLYENSLEVQLDTICENLPLVGYLFHIRNFKFKEGQTYHLKVKSDLGLEVESTCTIPMNRDFQITVDTSSRKTTNDYGERISILTAKISISDSPGELNYYRLLYLYERHYPSLNIIESSNPLSDDLTLSERDRMHNDIGQDGKKILVRTIEFTPKNLDDPSPEPDSSFLRFYLLNTDKPYYDFHMSLNDYPSGESLFTEPPFMYSNVKGGVGIFASYVIDSLIFRLK
jgi:hypothetical protein